jgi:Fe-S cluster assembly ATPase SufC
MTIMGNSKYILKSGDILLDNQSIKNLSPNERSKL